MNIRDIAKQSKQRQEQMKLSPITKMRLAIYYAFHHLTPSYRYELKRHIRLVREQFKNTSYEDWCEEYIREIN